MANGGGTPSEFLNPKSMFTPGAAGGAVLMMTNALGTHFGAHLAWTALVLSALFGLVVLNSALPKLQRFVFYVLNSLVIFAVAMGSNTTGQKLVSGGEPPPAISGEAEAGTQGQGFFKPWTF